MDNYAFFLFKQNNLGDNYESCIFETAIEIGG